MLRQVAIALILVLGAACQEKERPFVDFSKPSLVVLFKAGTTQHQINEFLDKYLFVKTSPTEDWPRPGVRSVVVTMVQGHDGYAVGFWETATVEQRRAIIEGLRSSPIVFAVFENTAPSKIVLDDSARGKT